MGAGTSDITTRAGDSQPSDGAAATWQIPDEANGFWSAGLRLFNLIPPFDDCRRFGFFFPLKSWEKVPRSVCTEGKRFILRGFDGLDSYGFFFFFRGENLLDDNPKNLPS